MQLVKITRMLGVLVFLAVSLSVQADEEKWGPGSNEHLKSYQRWKEYTRKFDEHNGKDSPHNRRGARLAAYNALNVLEENGVENHPAMIRTLINLGMANGEVGHVYYTRALAIQEKLDPNAAIMAKILVGLGGLYTKTSQHGLAKLHYERALPILKRPGSDQEKLGYLFEDLANIYKTEGDMARAVQYFERSLVIKMKVLKPNHTDLIAPLRNLSGLYVVLKRYKESEKLERFATQIEAMRR